MSENIIPHGASLPPTTSQRDRDQAEAELDWLFTVAVCQLEPPSNFGAMIAGIEAFGARDAASAALKSMAERPIAAVERSRPIRKALKQLEPHQAMALRLAFEPQSYHGEHAVMYLGEHGPKLAGIARHFFAEQTREQRQDNAAAMFRVALSCYVEARADQ